MTDAHRAAATFQQRAGGAAAGGGGRDDDALRRSFVSQNFRTMRVQRGFESVDNSNRPFALPPPLSPAAAARERDPLEHPLKDEIEALRPAWLSAPPPAGPARRPPGPAPPATWVDTPEALEARPISFPGPACAPPTPHLNRRPLLPTAEAGSDPGGAACDCGGPGSALNPLFPGAPAPASRLAPPLLIAAPPQAR